MEELARARPQAQALISAGAGSVALTKTHQCFGVDHGAPTINLGVTLAAIYIVRNPLDVAVSYAHHSGRTIDAVIDAMARPGFMTPPSERYISEVIGSWSQHVASWIGIASRPVLVIRYEDMLRDPVRTFGGLAQFLNLRPTEAQLNVD